MQSDIAPWVHISEVLAEVIRKSSKAYLLASSTTSGDRTVSEPRKNSVEPSDLSVNILGRREELFQAVSETADPKCDHPGTEQA